MDNTLLFNSFKKVYDDQNSSAPFSNTNLFSTIHLSENDHTNILWDIIRYRKNGEYKFLKSFIEDCLRLGDFKMEFENLETNATQYPSLSNKNESSTDKKKYGYIDLLLKDGVKVKDDDKKAIIIENKVCDAGDGKNQLARYYYTFAAKNNDTLDFLGNNTTQNTSLNDENIYVVYLTKDDSKIFPEKKYNSLPECLQKRLKLIQDGENNLIQDGENNLIQDGENNLIQDGENNLTEKDKQKSIYDEDFSIPKDSHYIHISYSEDILQWLKEKVLPEISAYNSDEFYRSVCLYVDYLENDVLGQTQQSRDIYLTKDYNDIVNGITDTTWKDLYKILLKESKQKSKKNASNKNTDDYKYINPYINFLKAQVTRKVNEAIEPIGWKSYCTPSFVLFYKTEWYNPSSKYNIPPLNLLINPNTLIKLEESKEKSKKVCFQIEHYKSDYKNWKDNLISKLEVVDIFNMDNNRKNTPSLKNGGTITVENDKIKIELNGQLNIEEAIKNSGF